MNPDRDLDFLSAPASDDSSATDDSTCPTTPGGSPWFSPSRGAILEDSSGENEPDITENGIDDDDYEVEPPPVSHICVVGAGYVGGPTAAVIALHHPTVRVEVVDKNPQRIAQWNSRHLPIREPGLEEVVRITRDGASSPRGDGNPDDSFRPPNLVFTTDARASIARADLIFLTVNTPTKSFGVGAGRATDMAVFDAAAREVARFLRPGAVIVEKSTVPCGTAQRLRQMLETVRPGVPVEIVSNPEFLSEGSAIKNLLQPDRVLIGAATTAAGRCAAARVARLYAAWVPPAHIVQVNGWSSELAKLVSNAMLAQRISSINAISAICDRTGADVDEIARAVGLDPRIGPHFLHAGLGFGGSCFRKDIASLTYLAESLGLPEVAAYWDQVNTVNLLQRRRFARTVIHRLEETLIGKKITLLGFAFKKDTGDTRESVAVDIIHTLLDERPAEIAIYDPCCRDEDIRREIELEASPSFSAQAGTVTVYQDPYQACKQAHAILIITDADQFRNASRTSSPPPSLTALQRKKKMTKLMMMNKKTSLKPSIFPSPSSPLSDPQVPDTDNDPIHKERENDPDNSGETEEEKSITIPITSPLSSNSVPDRNNDGYNHLRFHLRPQPPCCIPNCSECSTTTTTAQPLHEAKKKPTTRIDWNRIAYIMSEPRWVFDGRGVIDDILMMERLGFRVETVGRQREGQQMQKPNQGNLKKQNQPNHISTSSSPANALSTSTSCKNDW